MALLGEHIIAEMERLQYAPLTIKGFHREVLRLAEYAEKIGGTEFFNEELGARYLRETIGFPFETPHPLTSVEGAKIRCVRRIGEYQLYGAVLRNRSAKARSLKNWELGDEKIIAAYIDAVQTADNSEATKKLRIYHIRQFYEFLASRKINGVQNISAQIISDYALSLQGDSPVYTKHRLATLRFYFRFLWQSNILESDWSRAVPKVIAPQNLNIPALWEQSDLDRLLQGIDRGNPTGKRNYAIILLVVQLGLRVSDVANLRLDSLKWERREIQLIQHKTGKRVTQPLLDDVGWAIIDYIKYGRPKIDSPFVFLTVNAPYTQMLPASVGCILDRQRVRFCVHCLQRWTKQGYDPTTLLPRLTAYLGHNDFSATEQYLRMTAEAYPEVSRLMEEKYGYIIPGMEGSIDEND